MERIRIDYGALFRVNIRLTFFLNLGDEEFEHMTQEQQSSVLGSYDVRHHLDIQPTTETLLLLRRHRLIFRSDAMGFAVYTPLEGGKMRFRFIRSELPRFHLIAKNRHFSNISNLRIDDPISSQIHLFSTDVANADREGLHLSRPLEGFRSANDYPAGSQIINNIAQVTHRLTAVRNIASGAARDQDDWVATAELPQQMTQVHVDTLDAGGRARKDGVIYEALDDTPGIDETDVTKWRRLFAPGIQAASSADAIQLCGRFKIVQFSDAEPDFVAAELTDSTGRIVRREEFTGSLAHPLKVVSLDLGDQVGGVYSLMLRDRTGDLLTHNGNQLAQADQRLYVDGVAVRNNAFSVIEIRTDAAGYELNDLNSEVRSPTFLLRITSPVTFWSYTFPNPLTDDERNQLGESFELADGPGDRIITQKARGLGRGFVTLGRLNTGKLLPNPTEQTGIAIESATGRLISPNYLSHKS